jgi:hypothetical protein
MQNQDIDVPEQLYESRHKNLVAKVEAISFFINHVLLVSKKKLSTDAASS